MQTIESALCTASDTRAPSHETVVRNGRYASQSNHCVLAPVAAAGGRTAPSREKLCGRALYVEE
jgi:hypothetical protein